MPLMLDLCALMLGSLWCRGLIISERHAHHVFDDYVRKHDRSTSLAKDFFADEEAGLTGDEGIVDISTDEIVEELFNEDILRARAFSNNFNEIWDFAAYDSTGSSSHATKWDALKFHFFNTSIKIVLVTVFIVVAMQDEATILNAGFLIMSGALLYRGEWLLENGNKAFIWLVIYNWSDLFLQIAYQSPM